MPNWVTNKLEVSGEPEAVILLVEAIRCDNPERPGETICRLVDLMPMPGVLEGTTSPTPRTDEEEEHSERARQETGYSNWHDWQQAHWGVKWGDIHFQDELSDDGQVFTYSYDTPNEPLSRRFMEEVRERFPSLSFEMTYTDEENATTTVYWEPYENNEW